ncbi:GNAT family N-acetyltransferase [Priestia megaterium]|uniref:GNAT family N-acetyltransferase n=1 Tax=Priestia megaterium TaxID=1404 RepID=UPI003671B13E
MKIYKNQVFTKTDRLVLRKFSVSDTKYFHSYRSNPTVAMFQSWEDYQYSEAESFVNDQIKNMPNQPGTWFQFAIALSEDDQLIGDCALHTPLNEPRIVEIGFTLSPGYQGKGYASEAISGLLDYIFDSLGKHKVTAFSDVRNKKSIAVLERVNMRREGHLLQNYMSKGQWVDEYQYAILESEWKSQQGDRIDKKSRG